MLDLLIVLSLLCWAYLIVWVTVAFWRDAKAQRAWERENPRYTRR